MAMMNRAVTEIINISSITGKDTSLVQGGGGNTSVKTPDGKYMYVKASGTALKDMSAHRGWRRLKLAPLAAIVHDRSLLKLDVTAREDRITRLLLQCCDDQMPAGDRPSVESPLHALLGRCIIHLHPFVVSAFVNAADGKTELEKIFKKDKLPLLWVPYADPGFSLARRMARSIEQYARLHHRIPAVMFLEKHGLFVSAESPEAAVRLVRGTISRCKKRLTYPHRAGVDRVEPVRIAGAKLAIRGALHQSTGRYMSIRHSLDGAIAAFMKRSDAPRLARGPMSPDELVYAGGPPLWLDKLDTKILSRKLDAIAARGQRLPNAFLVKGLGLFAAGNEKTLPVVLDIDKGSLFVRSNASAMGGMKTLTSRQTDFINKWEMESYRLQLMGGESLGVLIDRIAVVTGAGSGLGRSIAIGLARAGAKVAAVDIDAPAAAKTVQIIESELPDAAAIPVKCNVTDENSVEDAYRTVLQAWGGLDILVNAAGLAPAHALVDLPVDQWRRALEVNLTGYFLMARGAGRIMIDQAMGGSIINVSSKSGLEASKNNTAYNATKAGELHMARGWAMEFGSYGIRVNSVCPGNVFEGSKIWNPRYIRQAAQKYGIKPEEVIPYYIDKTTLKREITGQDVADSVVFLCSEKARTITGQILVPDAGQVMVR